MDSVFKAFHYYDGLSGSWRLFNNGDRLTVRENGNVGIGTTLPAERLQVEGAIKIGNSSSANPTAGTVRWNPDTEDFEGYTGTTWKSLTMTSDKWGEASTPFNTENQYAYASDVGYLMKINLF